MMKIFWRVLCMGLAISITAIVMICGGIHAEAAEKVMLFSFDTLPLGLDESFKIDTKNKAEGSGALSWTAKGAKSLNLSVEMDTPVDVSNMKNPALHFYFYLSNRNAYGGDATIFLGKDFAQGNRLVIYLHESGLKTGLNEITIPLSADFRNVESSVFGQQFFVFAEAAFTLSNIRSMIFLAASRADLVIGIDGMEIIDLPGTQKPDEVVPETGGMLFSFDSLPAGYLGGQYWLDTDNKKQGSGSFMQTVTQKASLNFNGNSTNTVDASKYKNPALHFWVYFDNARNFEGDLTLLLGKDGAEGNRYVIYLHSTNFTNGWNEITIPLGKKYYGLECYMFGQMFFITAEKNADLSQLKFIIILASSKGALTFGLDGIEIVDLPDVGGKEKKETGGMLYSGDYLPPGYLGGVFSLDTVEKKEGSGALTLKLEEKQSLTVLINSNNTVNLNAYEKPCFSFWMYLSDPNSYLGDLTIFLGKSPAEGDRAVCYLHMEASQFAEGWNKVYIPLDASLSGQELRYGNINYFVTFEKNFSRAEIKTVLLLFNPDYAIEMKLDAMEICELPPIVKESSEKPSSFGGFEKESGAVQIDVETSEPVEEDRKFFWIVVVVLSAVFVLGGVAAIVIIKTKKIGSKTTASIELRQSAENGEDDT